MVPENTYISPGRPNEWKCKTCANYRARVRRDLRRATRKPPVPVPMPGEVAVLAYGAGLFDGEGSIGITVTRRAERPGRSYHRLMISLTSTDPEAVAWMQRNFGGYIGERKTPEGCKTAYSWQSNGKHSEAFLRAIRPYMVIKARQADLALAFRATHQVSSKGSVLGSVGRGGSVVQITPQLYAYREGLRQQIMALNRRGVAA